MAGLKVGIELEGSADAITAAVATVPWMSPERIVLDDRRCLVLLSTSFTDPYDACAYGVRRIRKSVTGIGLAITIHSTEAFPGGDEQEPASYRGMSGWRQG